jgi:UDP-glucose 4-epimerase
MRVFLTGGAGFIGSHIAESLVTAGHDVLAVDPLTTGRLENFAAAEADGADLLVRPLGDSHVDFRTHDPQIVVHCAASYKDPTAWERDVDTNVLQLAKLLEWCRSSRVERFVYFQTVLCYGIAAPRMPLPENWPIAPAGSYAITKTAAEQLILGSGLDAISFRLANIYGPLNRSGPIPAFYKRIKQGEPCTVV